MGQALQRFGMSSDTCLRSPGDCPGGPTCLYPVSRPDSISRPALPPLLSLRSVCCPEGPGSRLGAPATPTQGGGQGPGRPAFLPSHPQASPRSWGRGRVEVKFLAPSSRVHRGRHFQPLRVKLQALSGRLPTSPHPELKSHGLSLLCEGCKGVRIPLRRPRGQALRTRGGALHQAWGRSPSLRPAAVPVCCPDMRARHREDSHPRLPTGEGARVPAPGALCSRKDAQKGVSREGHLLGPAACVWARWMFVGWRLSCKSQPGAWRGGPSVARWRGDLELWCHSPLQGPCREDGCLRTHPGSGAGMPCTDGRCY